MWHKAAELTDVVYLLIARFPDSERFALADQMKRAAQSIEINIGEACGKKGDPEFGRYLKISMGSASELDACLEISKRQRFGGETERIRAAGLVTEVKKMLAALIRSLRPPGATR